MLSSLSFSVSSERLGDRHSIAPVGEVDLATAPVLEREFEQALGGDASTIALDLGGCTFMDSSGLRLLLLMAQRGAGRLRITGTTDQVERLIEIAGVRPALPLSPDGASGAAGHELPGEPSGENGRDGGLADRTRELTHQRGQRP